MTIHDAVKLLTRLKNGEVLIDELKAEYAKYIENKEEIIKDLMSRSKQKLVEIFCNRSAILYRMKDLKKDKLVNRIYVEYMLCYYPFHSFIIDRDDKEFYTTNISKLTQKDIDVFVEKENEYNGKKKEAMLELMDPKTLKGLEDKIRDKGFGSLTRDQVKRYDLFIAEKTFTPNENINDNIEKLNALAKKLEDLSLKKQEEANNANTNTWKRSNMAQNKLLDADKIMEKSIRVYNLIKAIKEGKIKYLGYLSAESQINVLNGKRIEKEEDIYLESVYYMHVNLEWLPVESHVEKGGKASYNYFKKIYEKLKEKKECSYMLSSKEDVDHFTNLFINSKDASWYKDDAKQYNSLKKMNITNPSLMRLALYEYLSLYQKVSTSNKKIREIEILRSNPGIDFFPTPSSIVDKMIDLIDITEYDKVLEPSAGSGNIAIPVREITKDIDVVEQSYSLCELLSLYEFTPINMDFKDYTKDGYDKIIMNPPFCEEIEHVRHAYDLLKDGGKMITITSASVKSNSTKKYVAFREWMEDKVTHEEYLESGTFMDRKEANTTMVASCIFVLEKRAV